MYVWGFTAGLLAKVFELAGLERDWDRGRNQPLPERFAVRVPKSVPSPMVDPADDADRSSERFVAPGHEPPGVVDRPAGSVSQP